MNRIGGEEPTPTPSQRNSPTPTAAALAGGADAFAPEDNPTADVPGTSAVDPVDMDPPVAVGGDEDMADAAHMDTVRQEKGAAAAGHGADVDKEWTMDRGSEGDAADEDDEETLEAEEALAQAEGRHQSGDTEAGVAPVPLHATADACHRATRMLCCMHLRYGLFVAFPA